MNQHEFGKQGQALAADFLKQKGYEILETNFHKRIGEIDLIALGPEKQYVFIEVKTRRGHGFGYPEESVNARKLSKMSRVAALWLLQHHLDPERFRLDVIAIEIKNNKPEITHLENIAP